MTEFSATTPFRLVRRLAAVGQDTPSVYLLICDAGEMDMVLADMAAEVQTQLGLNLRPLSASELRPESLEALAKHHAGDLVVVTLDHWLPTLVSSFDRNIVLFTAGGTVVLLAIRDIAERMLRGAPNLRNRLTDVLVLIPDGVLGDSRA
jgi:hypothetical protein